MSMCLTVRYPGPIPENVASKIREFAWVKGPQLEILSAEAIPWYLVFDILEENLMTLPSTSLIRVTDTEPFDWTHDYKQAVAAVLECADSYPPANPIEDYYPLLPSPHRGFVPSDKPLHLANKPAGYVAEVGEELIINTKLANFLGKLSCDAQSGKVIWQGEILREWVRLFPARQCGVISSDSLLPGIHCAICDALLIPRIGIWLAKPDAEFQECMATEEIGFDHLANRHPILLSCEVARQVAKVFRSGLILEPVYRMNSPKAAIVLEFINRVKRLVR